VLEDERQIAVLQVDPVEPIVVDGLLAEAEGEHPLAQRRSPFRERRTGDGPGDLLGVVEVAAPRRGLREGRELLRDAEVEQRRHARQIGAHDERAGEVDGRPEVGHPRTVGDRLRDQARRRHRRRRVPEPEARLGRDGDDLGSPPGGKGDDEGQRQDGGTAHERCSPYPNEDRVGRTLDGGASKAATDGRLEGAASRSSV
jgi:hypothetical protein